MKSQEELIIFAGDVRHKLCKNEFYSPDKLDTLLDIIKTEKGDVSNYISSYNIDYTNKTIQIQFRKAFMKKIDGNAYNSMTFYSIIDAIMKKFYNQYKTSIYSLMHVEDVIKFFSLPANLFYYIGRIGENTILINL